MAGGSFEDLAIGTKERPIALGVSVNAPARRPPVAVANGFPTTLAPPSAWRGTGFHQPMNLLPHSLSDIEDSGGGGGGAGGGAGAAGGGRGGGGGGGRGRGAGAPGARGAG